MKFSKGELTIMDMLWDGECLDENGEIQALELSKILDKKYGMGKTSCYTCFSRLLEKGAITRRYPKYTLKPVISRDEALKSQRADAIEKLFQGSLVNVCNAFLREKKVSKEELREIKELIANYDIED